MGSNRHHVRISARQASRLRAIAAFGVVTVFWTVFLLTTFAGSRVQ